MQILEIFNCGHFCLTIKLFLIIIAVAVKTNTLIPCSSICRTCFSVYLFQYFQRGLRVCEHILFAYLTYTDKSAP